MESKTGPDHTRSFFPENDFTPRFRLVAEYYVFPLPFVRPSDLLSYRCTHVHFFVKYSLMKLFEFCICTAQKK